MLLKRVWTTLMRRSHERDLDDEIRAHIDLLAAEYERRGMSPTEARYAARRAFGSVEPMKEVYRDRRGFRWIADLHQDFRYGIRALRRSPGFTVVAILTLALGIGANTAAFSLLDALDFRRLPVDAPDEIVHVLPMSDGVWDGVSRTEFTDYRQALHALVDVAAYAHVYMADAGDGREVDAYTVSGNFFNLLGVRPALGRFFLPSEDEAPGRDPVVVLAYGFWQRRFDADPRVLGKALFLNGQPFTIIGVAPSALRAPAYGDAVADAWIPWMMATVAKHAQATPFTMLGRLRHGATIESAQAELDAVVSHVVRPPGTGRRTFKAALAVGRPADVPHGEAVGTSTAPSVLLIGMCALLVVACLNLAGLLIARGLGRSREIATRRALGASGSRLVRQLITESVVLSCAGVLPGLLCALGCMHLIGRYYSAEAEGSIQFLDVRMDAAVFSFSIAVAVVAGILIGVWPAMQAVRTPLTIGHATARRSRAGAILLVAQVAISLALIVLAGLLSRTVRGVMSAPGFDVDHVAFLRAKTNIARLDERQSRTYFQEALRRLAAVPGVDAVAIAMFPPLNTWAVEDPISPADATENRVTVRWNRVTPTFFGALRIPVVEGRSFDDADAAPARRVVILNEALARRLWPGGSAIGRTAIYRAQPYTVVGVVHYTNFAKSDGLGRLFAFFPTSLPGNRLFVHVSGDPARSLPQLHQALTSVNQAVPVSEEMTLANLVDNSFLPVHLAALALNYSAVIGLGLSAIGLYGVLAYAVGRRTREIGVRVALGARAVHVARLVSLNAVVCLVVGIMLGLGGAAVSTRLIAPFLYGVSRTDLVTFSVAPVLLLVSGAAALALPLRRAMRVDPVITLRGE